MLDAQFIGTNLYFAINLAAALVSFAVFWLIFDAWAMQRHRVEILKWGGFLALAVGFLMHATATQVQAGDLSRYLGYAADALRALGYVGIILGQLLDPLQKVPEHHDSFPEPSAPSPTAVPEAAPASKKPARHHGLIAMAAPVNFVMPLLPLLAGILYLRRATTGLERHLGPVAWGFAGLTVFELLNAVLKLPVPTNPNLDRLIQPLGPVWWGSLLALAVAMAILGHWVWNYLVKRLQSQLFIILVAQALGLFLVSTVGFTFMLLQNIQKQSLADLSTASRVLEYAVASRQAETAAQAEAVTANQAVIGGVAARDHRALRRALADYMSRHNLTSLIITDGSGVVLMRGEDPDRFGDSRSSDPLIRRGLVGQPASSVVVQGGVIAPTVSLAAVAPVRGADGSIIGTVVAARAISNAFVDGVRASTGLDSAVYGGDVRAATTLVAPGGSDRAIGIRETTPAVTSQVLGEGKAYSGVATLQNRPYMSAFTPLKNINNVTVGMLLVAHPQEQIYATANRSIQLTFLFVAALILLLIYPIYLTSRFLSGQLK